MPWALSQAAKISPVTCVPKSCNAASTARALPRSGSDGSAAASVESVRLEPELRQALASRAERDHETTSSVIRKALREYLKVA
jgi:hypothetical protein